MNILIFRRIFVAQKFGDKFGYRPRREALVGNCQLPVEKLDLPAPSSHFLDPRRRCLGQTVTRQLARDLGHVTAVSHVTVTDD